MIRCFELEYDEPAAKFCTCVEAGFCFLLLRQSKPNQVKARRSVKLCAKVQLDRFFGYPHTGLVCAQRFQVYALGLMTPKTLEEPVGASQCSHRIPHQSLSEPSFGLAEVRWLLAAPIGIDEIAIDRDA